MVSDGKPAADANELDVIPSLHSSTAFGVLRFHVESFDLMMLYYSCKQFEASVLELVVADPPLLTQVVQMS